MLDIKFIRENVDIVQDAANNKNIVINVDELLKLDKKRTQLLVEIEDIRRQRNENTDEIKEVGGKPPKELVDRGIEYKKQLAKLEPTYREVDEAYMDLMYKVPNIPSKDTPIGKDEDENVPTDYYGVKPEFNFELKDHIELAKIHDLVDFDRGVKVHGFRGYFLKNELAAMHLGLMMHSMQIMIKNGYTPTIAPAIVKEDAMWHSGMFPFGRDDVFEIANGTEDEKGEKTKTKFFLAGTAEVPLVSMHSGETFENLDQPKKYVGFSPCYRGEVGSYGKDTKGLYRVHEFMKIEQVVICEADYEVSTKLQEEMIGISHEILDSLGLHYRDLFICTGDMGAGKYRMFDIETWMPSRDGYGETHSASNITDWQARRANIRYKTKDGKKKHVFMLNNTALASPRILIAILENFQQKNGSIVVPEVLRPYVGKDIIG